jgi:molybdopterin converting factor small subunit
LSVVKVSWFWNLPTRFVGSLFSQKKHKHHRKHREHREGRPKKPYTVIVEEELPEGVTKEELTKELAKEQQKKEEKNVRIVMQSYNHTNTQTHNHSITEKIELKI